MSPPNGPEEFKAAESSSEKQHFSQVLDDTASVEEIDFDLVAEERHSDDELEEYLSQQILNPNVDFTQMEQEARKKFILHQQIQDLLNRDLEKMAGKRKKGVNTWLMGDNFEGSCGVGKSDKMVTVPHSIQGKFKRVTCGYQHAIGRDHDGVMYSWGKNRFGQLGNGENETQMFPQFVRGVLERVRIKEVAAGWAHSLAVTQSGFLFSWGHNVLG